MTHDSGIDDEDEDDELDEGGEFDEGGEEERLLTIEHLELMMGDAQQRMEEADAGDLDPSDVYRLVFKDLGWDEATIEAGIADADNSLESQLWEHVGHRASAEVLVERALEKVEAEMREAATQDASPTP